MIAGGILEEDGLVVMVALGIWNTTALGFNRIFFFGGEVAFDCCGCVCCDGGLRGGAGRLSRCAF